jgi:hypothetical protein
VPRLLLVGVVGLGVAATPVSAAQAAPLPELTSMVLQLPRVNFNYQLVAGENFRVTFTIDRPAPAGGTIIEMRKFRDSGPIHTLPQQVTVPAGQTTAELVVGSVPIDPATATASHQQVSAHDGNLPGNVTLFDSLFVVARPPSDPRGNAVTQEAETGRLSDAQVIRELDSVELAGGRELVKAVNERGDVRRPVQRGGAVVVDGDRDRPRASAPGSGLATPSSTSPRTDDVPRSRARIG